MDLDIIQSTKEGEIAQFLCDVRDYFKASLATSEYENTSNIFYLTVSETTEQLLSRCEFLLNRLNNKSEETTINKSTFSTSSSPHRPNNQWQCRSEKKNEEANCNQTLTGVRENTKQIEYKDDSYIDMSSAPRYNSNNGITISKDDKSVDSLEDRDKMFRCSTFAVRQNKSFLHRTHDTMTTSDDDSNVKEDNKNGEDKVNNFKDDSQIYDICQVMTQESDVDDDEVGLEETQKAIATDSHISLYNIDCPYMDLPAGHLAINKSTKYGQLLRIEKRLFFDQSKKYYCGILNDWLLCYADGPTSNSPTISLYLKIPGIEIEHFGEGKRRDICFQITTADTNKRFVFQAINEIDAKEWIHAIEAAIRSDIKSLTMEVRTSTRKLPTPPIIKKLTFLSSFQRGNGMLSSNDCIYEEPSTTHEFVPTPSSQERPALPNKQNNPLVLAQKFEYDVPKCPPQPLKQNANDLHLINSCEDNQPNTSEKTHNLSSSTPCPVSAQKLCLKMEENLDFQAKVKDVHCKLTSQLSSGPNIKKSLKKSLSLSSQSAAESLANVQPIFSTSPTPAELKKQKKLTNSPSSPQKTPNEKSTFAKNWFLNRLNKTSPSNRSNSSSPSNSSCKCKQSEKENLLNSPTDICDGPLSPISKSSTANNGNSKVNMIINQLEASGHLASMFTADAVASFNSFCDNDCNNYEPIMTVSTPVNNFMKK